jgi:ribose transport system ATP-binding protein
MSEGRITGLLSADEASQERVMHYATLRPDENPEDAVELGLDEPALIGTPSATKAGEQ